MDIQRRRFIAGLGGVAVAAPVLLACSRGEGAKSSEKTGGPLPTSKSMVAGPVSGEPGTLTSQEPIDTGIKGARAWRITYISRDVNDVAHEVSGLVIAPAGRGQNRPILTGPRGRSAA